MSEFPEYIEMAGKPAEFDIREESTPPTMDGIVPIQKYVRLDLIPKQIEEAVKARWLDVRNKIIDKLQDQLADDQLQGVLQIIDDEEWFPRIAKAICNGEEA